MAVFAVTLLIFLIMVMVIKKTYKYPVYSESPADPNYTGKLVTMTLYTRAIEGKCPNYAHEISKILYIDNTLDMETQLDYIYEHKEDLFMVELSTLELEYKNRYNSRVIVDKVSVNVDNL